MIPAYAVTGSVDSVTLTKTMPCPCTWAFQQCHDAVLGQRSMLFLMNRPGFSTRIDMTPIDPG